MSNATIYAMDGGTGLVRFRAGGGSWRLGEWQVVNQVPVAASQPAAKYDALVFGNHCHGLGRKRLTELKRKYPAFPMLFGQHRLVGQGQGRRPAGTDSAVQDLPSQG